jgi:hypothetical protein
MLQAGFATITITPPVGAALQGYFLTRISDGILEDLYARVMILDDGERRVGLVTCDLIGVTRELTHEVRAIVADLTPGESLMLTASHTHTGPSGRDSEITPLHPEWRALLPKLIAGGIKTAVGRLQPAELAVGVGRESSVAFNRRFRMKDGTVKTNPGIGNPDIVEAVGPIDPAVGVVCVRSQATKQPLGVLVNYACHLDTTGGTKLSADYPGHLTRVLQQVFGKDLTVLFGTGPCGDINHIDVHYPGDFRRLDHPRRIGTILAGEAIKVIGRMHAFAAEVKSLSEIRLPYLEVTPEEIAAARALLADPRTPEPSTFRPEQLHARKIIRRSESTESHLLAEVQALRLGDTVIAGAPGEIFVELGLEIKARSPAANTLVIELANDATGYLPTPKAFTEGGYEVSSSPYASLAGEVLVERVVETFGRIC